MRAPVPAPLPVLQVDTNIFLKKEGRRLLAVLQEAFGGPPGAARRGLHVVAVVPWTVRLDVCPRCMTVPGLHCPRLNPQAEKAFDSSRL
jgi:hypothetical protein